MNGVFEINNAWWQAFPFSSSSSPPPTPLASFFALSPFFARPKLAFLGFPFPKNAQERLLRRLRSDEPRSLIVKIRNKNGLPYSAYDQVKTALSESQAEAEE